MFLIIDTETTGFPITKGFNKYYDPIDHNKYDSARIVQIAWKVLGDDFEEKWSEKLYY